MFKSIAIAAAIAASLGACALPASTGPAPAATKSACPAGEFIMSDTELTTPCDLIGGVNTLTLTDISPERCDAVGGTFDGDDGCVNVDF